MRRLAIHHRTEYRFPAAVGLLPHRLLLRPRESHVVRIASSSLRTVPAHEVQWHRDPFDNSVAVLSFAERSSLLSIESRVVIDHFDDQPLDFIVDKAAVTHPFTYDDEARNILAPFLAPIHPEDTAAIRQWLGTQGVGAGPLETFVLLDRLNRAIPSSFRYAAREEPGVQAPALTLRRGSGSCRDFAALLLDACRVLGIAARFVSGYLYSEVSAAGDGSTHAWVEVYLPGAGWTGFDPTTGALTGNGHVSVAVSRRPDAVPPIAGSFLGGPEDAPTMHVGVSVVEVVGVRA